MVTWGAEVADARGEWLEKAPPSLGDADLGPPCGCCCVGGSGREDMGSGMCSSRSLQKTDIFKSNRTMQNRVIRYAKMERPQGKWLHPYIVTFRHPDDRIVASFYNFLLQVKVAESERPDDP